MATATAPAPDPAAVSRIATQTAPAAPAAAASQTGAPAVFPYQPNHRLAAVLLGAGLLVIFGTGFATTVLQQRLSYTGGDCAASAAILFVLALVAESPSLILDDSPTAGGEPSTMRILTLAIVITFCALMLKAGWDHGSLPDLNNQGNWVWLVTAALGGKALQKFAETKDAGKQ